MSLEVLPIRTAGAAENMAADFLMLQRYPRGSVTRFRHYKWRSPAFTFGYSQKISAVRAVLPAGQNLDLCRRPTGGGIVDHRDDWTFSLVIPRGHSLEDARASHSYRAVHQCLANALQRQHVPAILKLVPDITGDPSPATVGFGRAKSDPRMKNDIRLMESVCFERAELFDVIHAETGEKIAGAAQKRNKRGLLFQGSVWRPALHIACDDDQLLADFLGELSVVLSEIVEEVPWPEYDEDELYGLTENYASAEWLESR